MEFVLILLIFVLGVVVGSFLNVLILRFNTGLTLGGRSMCLSCGKQLGTLELIPILSFIALRGKCRHCRSPISIQYPLVELATGLTFAGIYLKLFEGSSYIPHLYTEAVLFAAIWCVLIVIAGYDIRHKIIPDPFVAAFIVLSFCQGVLVYGRTLLGMPHSIDQLLAGPILAIPFALLWLMSGGRWIGFGDAKLALGIGWLLGLSPGTSAILLGFWSGACVSVVLLLLSKLPEHYLLRRSKIFSRTITGKTEIPFAPFLILGMALVFFFNLSVIAF